MAFFAKLADHKRSLFTFILLANLLLLRFWLLFLFLSNAKFSLRFLRNRQVSYSPTALGRALVLRESEANAGNFSPRRQTNVKKLRLSWQKRKISNVKWFWRSQNLLTGLRDHCFKQQKENQLFITKKHNQHNQKLNKILVGE